MMPVKRSLMGARYFGAAILGFGLASLQAAPIPKLYNTGVANDGALLPASTVDSHYRLIESPDAEYPGPDTFTLEPGFPRLDRGWPKAPVRAGSPAGPPGHGQRGRQLHLPHDLRSTGFDPAKARMAGKWTSDNSGLDIVINGTSLGLGQGGDFGAFTDFVIESGFVEGVNTLDFLVNNAGDAVNPAGLRVELLGTVEIAGEKPRIVSPRRWAAPTFWGTTSRSASWRTARRRSPTSGSATAPTSRAPRNPRCCSRESPWPRAAITRCW